MSVQTFKIVILLLIVSGCVVISTPKENTDFNTLMHIGQLEGQYQNLGEGITDSYPVYLSTLIWPTARDLDHESIDTVEVQKVNENTLLVKAFAQGITFKESTFVEGEDFELSEGRIRLKQEATFLGVKGEPIVGPYYDSIELGLDQRGQGKSRQISAVAALVYLAIPVAGVRTSDVRFSRIR